MGFEVKRFECKERLLSNQPTIVGPCFLSLSKL